MALLDNDTISAWSADTHWSGDTDGISATFEFDDFVGSMGFVTSLALLAEKADHHPDIDVRWNKVTLALATHSEGGVTQRDLDLAEGISRLADR